jgi:hypothetical protein
VLCQRVKGYLQTDFLIFFLKKKKIKNQFLMMRRVSYIYIYIYYSDLACIEHEESKHAPHLHFSYK